MSRAENFRNDKTNPSPGGGFAKRHGFFLSEDELAKLGIKVWTGDAGEKGEGVVNYVHILPAHKDDPDLIALPLWGHNNVGPNGDGFLCPSMIKRELERRKLPVPECIADGKCPMCEMGDRLFKEHQAAKDRMSEADNKASWQRVASYRPYQGKYSDPRPKRYLAWVVDAASQETEREGVCLWPMPTQVFEDGIRELSEDPRNKGADGHPAFVDILDPNAGFVFAFKKSGQKIGTTYAGYRLLPREFSIAKEEPGWLAAVPRYLDVLNFASYAEIATAMGEDEPPASHEPEPQPGRRYDRGAREVGREADHPPRGAAGSAAETTSRETAPTARTDDRPGRRGYAEAPADAEPNPMTRSRGANSAATTAATETASPSEPPRRRGYTEPEQVAPSGPSQSEQDAMRERIRKAREARGRTT